ncbi:hypothetical protein [Sporolactobacillus nakayamae]|uniref:Uncharacterized protein n=1 Tax=Sporolactobacillus nakayamae TaxID=269670 RepID=A0A1I2VA15_9BACL|nr:hypothetical protein [Sporolactobacillus nakayamae]SFG84246.1 hypothetical protein SAMN02982927_02960 [Sporolactobacillus nakayamae]
MLGHLGFSYVGLIYLLMLFIPNIVWSKHQPIDYDYSQEDKRLLVLERIGQVCCTCSVLIFSDFNIAPFSLWSLWIIVSFVLMLVYEICWVRYFIDEHTENNFYRSFCGVPVPLASLPVTAFLLLGIYGKVIWLIASALLLGIGLIGIHIQHLKSIKKR